MIHGLLKSLRSQTSYATHGYHRYPAKFIPQLAARIIQQNSLARDLICDPFMGSATTLVEAIVHDRKAYGTDINPVGSPIARTKTTPIPPLTLKNEVEVILKDLYFFTIEKDPKHKTPAYNQYNHLQDKQPDLERIHYWFAEKQRHDLVSILSRISAVKSPKIRDFLLCGFSNILKLCSRWLMKSVKPTIDKDKIIAGAYKSFSVQIRHMMKKNEEFFVLVGNKRIECVVDNVDARRMNLKSGSVELIVTSPHMSRLTNMLTCTNSLHYDCSILEVYQTLEKNSLVLFRKKMDEERSIVALGKKP
jgi:hypothetical protein